MQSAKGVIPADFIDKKIVQWHHNKFYRLDTYEDIKFS
jgi:hypothetical protein